MNKNLYRVIFNKARGLLMVVAENGRGHGKGPAVSGEGHTLSQLIGQLTPLAFFTLGALGMVALMPQAQAAGIVADGKAPSGQQPMVGKTANGTPQVNIQAPSAGGVSRNNYSQFDVDKKGVILNNSHRDVRTQQGGWVSGNPYLARGEAKVILNEVNSRDPSKLNGYIEVAGKRAQVVIANPAGITCDGCGFINANRASLTTGKAIIQNGQLTGYQVNGGQIVVQGAGMDSSRQDYTDLIAHTVQVNSGIWANDLKVTTGKNRVSADGKNISKNSAGDNDAKPVLALDVAQLGGMYAGKIQLIGTEKGVGVRNAGTLGAQAGSVTISADGHIENSGKINASDDIQLSGSALTNSGTLYARRDVQATVSDQLNNDGMVVASRHTRVSAGAIDSSKKSVFGAGVKSDGSLGTEGDLTLTSSGKLASHGQNMAAGKLAIQGTEIDLSDSQSSGADVALTTNGTLNNDRGKISALSGDLVATSGQLSNSSGTLYAARDLTASVSGELNNDGLIAAGRDTHASAADLNSSKNSVFGGGISADGSVGKSGNLTLSGQRKIASHGQNLAAGKLEMQAAEIDLSDSRSAGSAVTVNSAGSLNNDRGMISALAGDLSLTSAQLDNNGGRLESAGDVQVRSTGINNVGGTMVGQQLTLDSGGLALNNQNGGIAAVESATLSAGGLNNEGGKVITGKNLHGDLQSVSGNGQLLSLGDMQLAVNGDFSNAGSTLANGNLDLAVQGALENTGQLSAGQQLAVTAADLNNQQSGDISGQITHVDVARELNNRGVIDGVETVLRAGTLNNIGTGRIYGDHLAIQAGELNNLMEGESAATIAARQRLDLGVGTLNNSAHSLIYSGGDMSIGGQLDEDFAASGRATTLNNHSATIESAGNMLINTATLNNINDHFATGMVHISDEQKDEYMVVGLNNGVHYGTSDYDISFYHDEVQHICISGVICKQDHYYQYAYTQSTWQEQITESDPAQIIAGGNLSINADSTLNDKSRIIAGSDLLVSNANLKNVEQAGTLLIQKVGQVIEWDRIHKKGHDKQKHDASPYTPPDEIQSIALSPSVATGNTRTDSSAPALNGYSLGLLNSGDLASLPGGQRIEIAGGTDSTVIRSQVPDTTLPENSLFNQLPSASSSYLIETDPRYTNQKTWLSSDFMLSQLQSDPDITQKRLGDGFYEQRLVREQLVELTGDRYLAGYQSDEDQYKALMEAGVAFGKTFNLVPGVALTASQMANITSDMVWLVARDVTLADGSRQSVLVPQVYAQVKQGDIDGSGALLAGRNIAIGVSGNMLNSGRVNASQLLSISGDTITNVGGIISGGSVQLLANNDLTNNGGLIQAQNSLVASAGRDLNLVSQTTHTESRNGSNSFSRDTVSRVAGMYVQQDNGKLALQAARDVNVQGAKVVNAGENSQTTVVAGRDINLTAVHAGSSDSVVWNKDNHLSQSSTTAVGSEITGAGDVALQAANNLTAAAATLNATNSLSLTAGNDMTIGTAGEQSSLDMASKVKGSGFMSSNTTTTRAGFNQQNVAGSNLGGQDITLSAGHDLGINGSNVAADDSLTAKAGNNLTVDSAQESRDGWAMTQKTKSGLMSSGGIGFTVGSTFNKSTDETTGQTAKGSQLGSVSGDTTLIAGNDLKISGSDVIAGNDINLMGKNVEIGSAENRASKHSTTESRSSGLTLALSGAVGSALSTAKTISEMETDKQDDRVARLQQVKAGLDGYQAAQAVRGAVQDPTNTSFVGISLSLGMQKAQSESQSDQMTSAGSAIQAARDLNIFATGSDGSMQDGDILVQGSQLQAGNEMLLSASRDISLLSAENTQLSSSSKSSGGGAVGASIGVGSGGWGISIFANGNKGKGSENGDGLTHNETTLDAGNKVTLLSGRDTTLTGAQVSADRIVADVGRDLTITSEQDSNNYKSKDQNISGGLSFTFGSMTASGSLSISNDKINSNYDSVQEQSGLFAGDSGYDVTVGNHTQLNGAVIGSTAETAKNRLDTGTLGFTDIQNQADYDTSGVSLGMTSSVSLKDEDNSSLPADKQTEKRTVTQQLGDNLAPTSMSASRSSGSGESTTYSAVSDGTLIVRNSDAQQQDVSTLSRDVEHANQTLSPIFDKAKEQKRLQTVQLIGQVASQTVSAAIAEREYWALEAGIKEAGEAPGADATKQDRAAYWERVKGSDIYQDMMKDYKDDGSIKMAANAAATAITALAGGDASKALAQASAPYMAGVIKDLTLSDPKNPTAEEIATNAFAHAILGGVVAEMSGQNAAAGAAGAGGGELAIRTIHNALYPDVATSDLNDQQKSTIKNLALIASSLAGAVASGDSQGAAEGYNAGKNAMEHNYLSAGEAERKAVLERKERLGTLSAAEASELSATRKVDKARDQAIKDVCTNGNKGGAACTALVSKAQQALDSYGKSVSVRLLYSELYPQDAANASAIMSGVDAGSVTRDRAITAIARDSGKSWDEIADRYDTVMQLHAITVSLASAYMPGTMKAPAASGKTVNSGSTANIMEEAAALERIAQNNKNATDLSTKTTGMVYQQQAQNKINDLAAMYNNASLTPKDFTLSMNGKTLMADPNTSIGAPVFKGASEAEVKTYFQQISGAEVLPAAKTIPGKGTLYSVKVTSGANAGSTMTLRDFSNSTGQTGAKWTIDVITPSINKGKKVEMKFQ
ncbi:two-partner secretion domain-containing protein [Erwinia sorbitola]|uniref:Filamentous hemagglutinin N-terminal domain-containing protein n=1 Tax=Erwinia sorbitola TaxID=2681984 RepID=A0A6I6EQJ1_9GAMM|nr:hemagglutinin repeat-containing protein [Erwinia sorbitola]QGU89031.1 filamentous hemagglutinin N-terminal domain-containing protein [Erwinia sorbitola]